MTSREFPMSGSVRLVAVDSTRKVTQRIDSNGKYAITGLAPGAYHMVCAPLSSRVFVRVGSIRVVSGRTTKVNCVFPDHSTPYAEHF